ncbi:MAG: hypothetical protein LC785_11110 [Acidobacteria bacterium]|nr:hypothetical protein [Acidobacteriota bacterium]MCA1642474.1 hypothetical protein [Acidobacteriota bacterium]
MVVVAAAAAAVVVASLWSSQCLTSISGTVSACAADSSIERSTASALPLLASSSTAVA